MTTELNSREVINLVLNAIEFENLMSDDIYDFLLDIGLNSEEADVCINEISEEL